jgi:hypothetical protein
MLEAQMLVSDVGQPYRPAEHGGDKSMALYWLDRRMFEIVHKG